MNLWQILLFYCFIFFEIPKNTGDNCLIFKILNLHFKWSLYKSMSSKSFDYFRIHKDLFINIKSKDKMLFNFIFISIIIILKKSFYLKVFSHHKLCINIQHATQHQLLFIDSNHNCSHAFSCNIDSIKN